MPELLSTQISNSRKIRRLATDEEKIYFAGLFDGEGGVNGYFDAHGSPRLRCHLTNAVLEPMCLAREIYGGLIPPKRWKDKAGNYPKALTWYLNEQHEQVRFLENLAPHVRIKRRVIELALEYFSLADSGLRGRIKYDIVLLEKKRRRHEIVIEIRALNASKLYGMGGCNNANG